MPPTDLNLETQKPESEVSRDDQSQDQLRELYIEQQRRLSCPGCGETPHIY